MAERVLQLDFNTANDFHSVESGTTSLFSLRYNMRARYNTLNVPALGSSLPHQ